MKNINEPLSVNESESNKPNQANGFSDYFLFRKMISLTLIQIIYVIGIVIISIKGLELIAMGNNLRYGGELVSLGGLGILILGNIV